MKKRQQKPRLHIEELEPRILHSADAAALAPVAHVAQLVEMRVVDAAPIASDEAAPAAQAQSAHREIVIVDSAVADYQALVDDIQATRGANLAVYVLDRSADGVAQITDILARESGLAAVHVISHGAQGALELGSGVLDAAALARESDAISSWARAFTADGDLLLYGCDVAGGAQGRAFVDALAGVTGADVAASTDLTGSAARGGDWTLEYNAGRIESASPLSLAMQQAWQGTLGHVDAAVTWSPTVAGSWETKDLSGVGFNVPANAVLEVAISNSDTVNAQTGGVRADGSALDRAFALNRPTGGATNLTMLVQADANGKIQTFASDTAAVTYTLLGYWTNGTYVETAGSFNATADAAWQGHDLSSYGVAAGSVAEVVITNTSSNSSQVGVRTEGSGLDRLAEIRNRGTGTGAETVTMLVKAGNTGTVEAYTANDSASVTFNVVGYWSTAPGAYTELAEYLGQPGTSGAWETTSLALYGVPDGVVADVLFANQETGVSNTAGVRDVGSTDNRVLALNSHGSTGTPGPDNARMLATTTRDGASSIQWFDSNAATSSFYLMGYFQNNAPTLSAAHDLTAVNEDTAAASIGGDLVSSLMTAADADGETPGIAVTAADNANGAWEYSTDGGGTWTAFGAVAESSARLLDPTARVRFVPNANFAGTVAAGLTFRAWDRSTGASGSTADASTNGGATAFSGTSASAGVTITGINDAPVRTAGSVNNLTVLEDAAATSLGLGTLAYGTGGGSDESSQTLTYTVTAIPAAALGNVTLSDGVTAVSASTSYSLAQLQGMKFKAAANTNGGPATFTWTVTDNGGTANGGANTLTESLSISVTSVNDAPSGADKTVTMLEDGVYTFATADFGFSDAADSNALMNVKIGAITGAGSLTLSGLAVTAGQSISAASIAAGNLKFAPAANGNGAGYASFTFQVQDDGGTANGGVDLDPVANTITIDVTAVNDAPAGTDKTVTVNEDGVHTFATADFGFSDAADSNALMNVKIGAITGAGSLTLSGIAVTAGQSISAASIAAGNLKFAPAANANGAGYASFTFQVQDDGGTANGGVDLDPVANTLTIDVASVNDAPSGTDKTVTMLEDGVYTLAAADFGFSDAADSNALMNVKIASIPGGGSLTLSGLAVTAGQSISVANIAAGNLKFAPAANANGAGYASFAFQVQDDGGTANGGVDLDPVANTITFDVTAVNDAPVLSGTNDLAGINRNPGSNPGTLVADLLSGHVTEADATDPQGIAVTAVDNANGAWQYSTDGGATWTAFGTPTAAGARLLAADIHTFVRFVPNSNWSGTVANGLTFKAWDQSAGVAGSTADATAGGGAGAFSSATASASISVTAGNTAPTLSSTNNLTSIAEDAVGNGGTLVSSIIAGHTSDVDPGAVAGIAVTGADNTNGAWQYSLDGGSSWTGFGAPTATAARLLASDANTYVRFVPNANWNGTVGSGLTFRAWDRTTGVAGGTADTSGLSATFRDDFQSASYANNNGSTSWAGPWVETDSAGGGASGGHIQISGGTLQIQAATAGDSIYREVNLTGATSASVSFTFWSSLKAPAVVQLQVSKDGGATYSAVAGGTFSSGSIGSRTFDITSSISANTRIRWFVSSAESTSSTIYVGRMEIAANGNNGGSTAFSTATASAAITVNAVNDPPVRTAGAVNNLTVNEDAAATSLGLGTLAYGTGGGSDEASQTLTYTVTAIPIASLGSVTLADGVTAVTANTTYSLAQLQGMKFKAAADANGGPDTFSWTVTDNGGGTDTVTESLTVTVTAVNDAPVLTGANDLGAINRNPTSNSGTLVADLISGRVTDADTDAVQGIAVTGVDNTNGTWQYSTDGGATWTAFGAPTAASARLLAADVGTYVRFVPNANFSGTVSNGLTFRAWDQTSGAAGATADATSGGAAGAFSAASASASIVVTASNTAPTLTGSNNLSAINEDATGNAGTLVSALIAGMTNDVDPAAASGIAVTAVDNTNGTWQYSLNGGTTWTSFGAPSQTAARLLAADANTYVRFVPNANFNGAVANGITFRAWDRTGGVAGGTADTSGTSGTYSDGFITVSYANSDGSLAWAGPWVESDSAGGGAAAGRFKVSGGSLAIQATNVGDYIYRELDLSGASGATLSFTWSSGLKNNAEIEVQISSDGGATYTTPAGGVFDALTHKFAGTATFDITASASANTRIRWYVTGSEPGPDKNAFSIGDVQITTTALNGGSTAFSTATASASVTVNAVNDAPVRTAGAVNNLTVLEDAAAVSLGLNTLAYGTGGGADEASQTLTYTVTTIPAAALGSVTLADGVTAVSANTTYSLAQLQGMKFRAASNANGGPATFTWTVTDNGGTANGGANTLAESLSISVTSVNDAPSGADKTVTMLEDGVYTFATADFGFSDSADSNALLNVKIGAIPGAGNLTLSGVAVTAGQSISAASIAAGNLKFAPAANANGAGYASFTFQVQDDGGTANGGVDLDPVANTFTIDVLSVNDAPSGANRTVATLEDTAYTFTAADFGFSDVRDGNAFAAVRIGALPAGGSLTLSGVAVTAGQSVSAASIAAGNLRFAPAANANGAGYASFTFQVQDDGGTANGGADLDPVARTMTIDVTPVNDAPSGADRTVAVLEDTPYTFTAADFGFSDVKDGNALAAVRVGALPTAGSLTLSGVALTAGQSISAASIAAGNLKFAPAANANGAAYASFTFQVQDDGGTANGGTDLDPASHTLTIDVTPVNDAPSGASKTVSTLEDTPYVFTAADFGFSDAVEGNALAAVKIVSTPAAGTLTLAGAAVAANQFVSAAAIAAGDFRFTPAADANGAGYASFAFLVQDDGGTAGGGVDLDPVARTITVDVTPVSDAPRGASATVTTLEDTAYTFSIADFGFSDAADGNALFAVKVSALPGAGSLTLAGAAVAANQFVSAAAIAAGDLVFTPAANANGAGYASFAFQVQDDGGTANGGADLDATARTMTIAVTPVNDAPSGADRTVTTLEDTPYTFTTADFGFADAADAADALIAVKIVVPPGAGTLAYDFVPVSANQVVTAADIAAGKLMFMPALDANASAYASFTFQVQDDGGTANGGADTDPVARTMTVAVTSVNDAPSGASHTVDTLEDTPYVFGLADFGFSDASDGNALSAVKIASLPAAGALTLSGVALAANQSVAASRIAAGDLVFTPAANANGAAYASFTFQVQDDGGTADGGVDLDPVARTMTVAVTPVNDAPTGSDNTVSTLEDTAYRFALSDFGYGDPADGHAFVAVGIGSVSGAGSLTLAGAVVSAGQTISAAAIAAGDLVYTPAANDNGAARASFTFRVQDGGGTANGGADTDALARTMRIDVASVNDAPQGADATLKAREGVDYLLAAGDFGFADAADAPADVLLNVRIVSVSGSGAFMLGASTVAAGDIVPAARIVAGDLRFSPGAAGSGSGYATLVFRVQDDGGTARGGADTDASARTITVDVQKKPPPPVVDSTPPPAPASPPAPVAQAEAASADSSSSSDARSKSTLARIAAELASAVSRTLAVPLIDTSGEVAALPVAADVRADAVASIAPASSTTARRDSGAGANAIVPILLDLRAEAPAPAPLAISLAGSRGSAVAASAPADSSSEKDELARQAYALLTVENGVRASAIIVSAGMVTWTLHGAGLIASLLTSAPAWRHLDPLPVLAPESEKPDWGENDEDAQREEDAADRLWLGSSSRTSRSL